MKPVQNRLVLKGIMHTKFPFSFFEISLLPQSQNLFKTGLVINMVSNHILKGLVPYSQS
jgi:hypothetical protein